MKNSASKEANAPHFEPRTSVESTNSLNTFKFAQAGPRVRNPSAKAAPISVNAVNGTAQPVKHNPNAITNGLNGQTKFPSNAPRPIRRVASPRSPPVVYDDTVPDFDAGVPELGFQDEPVDPSFFSQDDNARTIEKDNRDQASVHRQDRVDGKDPALAKKRTRRMDGYSTPDDKQGPAKKVNTGSASHRGMASDPNKGQSASIALNTSRIGPTFRSLNSIAASEGVSGSPKSKKGPSAGERNFKITGVPRYPLPVQATQTQPLAAHTEKQAGGVRHPHRKTRGSDSDELDDDVEDKEDYEQAESSLLAALTRSGDMQAKVSHPEEDTSDFDGIHDLPDEQERTLAVQIENGAAQGGDFLPSPPRLYSDMDEFPTEDPEPKQDRRRESFKGRNARLKNIQNTPTQGITDVRVPSPELEELLEAGMSQSAQEDSQQQEESIMEPPEQRPGCQCGKCPLPPRAERDRYDFQTFDEWCGEGQEYIQKLPEVLNKMLDLMKSRLQVMSTLASKPEQYKDTIVAKQAENEAQKLKIKAWKNGLPFGGQLGASRSNSVLNTPPGSQNT